MKLSCAGVLFLALIGLAACQSDSTDDSGSFRPSYIRLAPLAPPEAPVENPPILDNPQTQIWRQGHWHWNGGSYEWMAGEIMPRPSPTAVWSPDRWAKLEYGWAFVPGYWQ